MVSYTTTPHTHTTPTVYASFTIRFIHNDHPSIPSQSSIHLNHQFISIILFVLSRSSIHISINPFHHSIHSISVINPFHSSIPSFYSFHLSHQSIPFIHSVILFIPSQLSIINLNSHYQSIHLTSTLPLRWFISSK